MQIKRKLTLATKIQQIDPKKNAEKIYIIFKTDQKQQRLIDRNSQDPRILICKDHNFRGDEQLIM